MSQQSSLDTAKRGAENIKFDKEIPKKKRYISPEKRRQIIDEPRLE